MNTSLFIVATCLLLTPMTLAETQLKNQKDKLSYSIGLEAGKTIKSRSIEVDDEILRAGIKDGLSGNKPRLEEGEMKELMTSLQNDFMKKQVATRKANGEKNAVEGPRFLAENKAREGVKTTASGLQYKILHEGTGPTPKLTDRVVVNFTGMTIDGREFENSYKSGHAETLPIDRVIKGWREGLQLMNEGSKFRLFVPADLAYGKNGAGVIAPNATLIFDMELVGIVPKPATASVDIHNSPGAPTSTKAP